MSIRLNTFSQNEYYHIYNRGNSKQVIFHDNEDMRHFQYLLYISNNSERFRTRFFSNGGSSKSIDVQTENRLVAIGSYCIMPNHFHILITPLTDEGVSKFMQKLSTAYSMYYNKKYTHSGGIYEGKFKAKHITDDNHMKYLFSYINLNPVKLIDPNWKKYGIKNIDKTFKFLDTYKFSSYFDLCNYGNKNKLSNYADILFLNKFPEYFPTGSKFKKEIILWLSYSSKI